MDQFLRGRNFTNSNFDWFCVDWFLWTNSLNTFCIDLLSRLERDKNIFLKLNFQNLDKKWIYTQYLKIWVYVLFESIFTHSKNLRRYFKNVFQEDLFSWTPETKILRKESKRMQTVQKFANLQNFIHMKIYPLS